MMYLHDSTVSQVYHLALYSSEIDLASRMLITHGEKLSSWFVKGDEGRDSIILCLCLGINKTKSLDSEVTDFSISLVSKSTDLAERNSLF